MNDHDDQLFDERLRDLPVPTGIVARVAPAALFDDAAIDRLLLRVDMPSGLEDRLRLTLADLANGGLLPPHGGRGAAVPVETSARPVARGGWSAGRMLGWLASGDLLADSAAVAAALSIMALMFFAGTEFSRRLAAPADAARQVVLHRAGERERSAAATAPTTAPAVPTSRRDASPQKESPRAGESAPGGDQGIALGGRLASDAGPAAEGGASDLGGGSVPAAQSVETADRPVELRASPVFSPVANAARGGAGGIRTVLLPTGGRRVPRVPGFDIAFEMAHGESPFIDPAVATTLATDHPPLSLRTDSFDMLCGGVRRDGVRSTVRRTSRSGMPVVRVEDILAALPTDAESGRWEGPGIGLSIHAVRSLRTSPVSLLVEVCATAPPVTGTDAEPGAGRPLDAMLLLDQSAGPFATLSWQWICRGLARLGGQMRSADRLSLIVCGERPRLVALRADAAQIAGLLPELARESVVKSADFDAAFRLAAAVGRREGRPDKVVAVAHAGSLEQCREEGHAAFSAWQAERAAGTAPAVPAVDFVVVDPQEPLADVSGQRPTNEGGEARIAADPIAIGRAMVARAFGRPTLVATGCRLEVAFDPGRVGAYRIIGHRQTAADALATDRPKPIELHAGESVRVVYEVVRRPGGGTATVGGLVAATLAWTPAAVAGRNAVGRGVESGTDGEQRVRVSFDQMDSHHGNVGDGNAPVPGSSRAATPELGGGLPSRHECELLLAVALGELMGASVHAEPWRQTAVGITALASRWQARGDVTPLGRLLLECLEQYGAGDQPISR